MERYVFRIFWALLALLIIVFGATITKSGNDSFHAYFELSAYNGVVQFHSIAVEEDILSFQCSLPDVSIQMPYLAVSSQKPMLLFLGDRQLDTEVFETVSISSRDWFLFAMPSDCRAQKLRMYFYSYGLLSEGTPTAGQLTELPQISFGTKSVLLSNLSMSSNLHIIAASILFCVVLLILLVHIIFQFVYKMKSYICYLGFSFLGFSIWILCESVLAMSHLNSYSIDIIKCCSIFIIPVLLFRYISLEFPKNYRWFFIILSLFHFILLLGAVIGMMLQRFRFYDIEQMMWFIFICSLMQCICCLSVEAADNKRMKNLYMGITLVFFTFFVYLLFYNFRPMIAVTSLVAGSSLLILYNLIILIFKGIHIYELSQERKNIELQLNEQVKHYKILETKDAEYRKLRHDMKNHWQVMTLLLHNGRSDDAQLYSEQMQSELAFLKRRHFLNTGNAFLDAILTSKIEYAANSGIAVHSEIMVVRDMKIDMMDHSIIFGNLMDNAIEACAKVEGEKEIFIKMLYKKGMLACSFVNSIVDGQKIDEALTTDKQDTLQHGFGVGNIRTAVAKYGGQLQIKISDRRFEAAFVLVDV